MKVETVKIEKFNFTASELSTILDELLNTDWDDERDVQISADALHCMRAIAIIANKRIEQCNESLHSADKIIEELQKRVQLGQDIVSRLIDTDMDGNISTHPMSLTGKFAHDIYTFCSGT